MHNKFLFLTLILSLWSCAEKSAQLSVATPAVAPVAEPVKASQPLADTKFDFSFEELHGAANYTTVIFSRRINDQIAHQKTIPVFKCDPKSDDEINVWSMQLKSALDEQAIYVEQSILTDKKYLEKFAQCEKSCLCGAYAGVLESINPAQLNKTQLFLLGDMERKNKEMTEDQMLTCAKQLKNFCGSKLHKYLQKLARQ